MVNRLLIYSGGTSVGQYAIQLAKRSGLRIITTASECRSDELKALGADVVIDYRAKNVVELLKEATGDQIEYALDCYGEDGLQVVHDAISNKTGGVAVTVLFLDPSVVTRKDIKFTQTIVYTGLSYTPDDIWFGPYKFVATPGDRDFLVKWYKRYPELLTTLGIKFPKIQEFDGLDNIDEAIDAVRSNKFPGRKLIIRV